MSDKIGQYILPGGQLSLLPESVDDDCLEQREFAQGIYSGERLKASDPDKYMAICGLLAEGSLSQRHISRLTGCSRNLISAINRQTSDIEPLKSKLAGRSRNVAELCMERIEEMLKDPEAKLSLKDLMVGAGIGTEKFLLLSGEATERIEVERVNPSAFNDRLAALPPEQRDKLAAMGLAAEISRAKGAPIDGEFELLADGRAVDAGDAVEAGK